MFLRSMIREKGYIYIILSKKIQNVKYNLITIIFQNSLCMHKLGRNMPNC